MKLFLYIALLSILSLYVGLDVFTSPCRKWKNIPTSHHTLYEAFFVCIKKQLLTTDHTTTTPAHVNKIGFAISVPTTVHIYAYKWWASQRNASVILYHFPL
eukprot:NODE_5700_length_558_cov_41.510806_g4963_i0.p1 GENE.NODE_5700_length_558_cov_41.510806_g4963_i0~~NODE_5700_length_558_cov_41.510806_g4963_i0.p1  ORF type:complete len:101 (-),score=1.64 NODE_5700_length_558_cov_41.510806_g4963_i0:217-519(-)